VTLRDEQGRPVRLVGITTDITKRKLAEEALRESEEKFSKVFKASPHRITITTLDEGRYIDVNDAVLRATGYERSEMIGHTAEEIQIFAEPEGREKLLRAFQDRSIRDLELQLRSKNGEVMTVLMSAEIITLNGRQCIVTLSNDITARVRAEEALRESEDQFRTLANTVPSIIWMAAPDGTITFHNQQWFDYCGVSPGQNGDWMRLVIHPDDLERCLAEWTSAGELGCEFETELRLRRRDGQYRWFLVRATPVRDAEGGVANWFGVVTDIHDSKQVEEARRESDERLRLAMEAAGMSVWETDLASGRVVWLDFGEQMMGVKPGSFGGTYESFLSLVHPDDRESVFEARNRALRGEAPYELEFRTMRDDGGVRWGLVRGVVHRDEQGAPTRIVGVNVDITERKQMEDALRLSEERYRLLVRTSSNVVIITDVNGGNPDSGSDWWEQLTGQAWDETRNRGWMKCVHPDDYDETAATWRNAIAKQEPFETEFRVRARDGDYCWLHFTGAPIRDARQQFREWAIALRDITKRKQAEEQLREKEKFIQSLVDAVPLGIYIFDLREMRTVFSNPQLASLLGYEVGEIEALGSEILPLIIHPEDQEIVYEHLARQGSAPDGSVLEVECRVKRRSGEWRWFASRDLVFMRDADGKPRRILGVTQDITERKRAEVTLRENAERLRLAMEAANAGSFDWDIASGVIVWTPNRLGSP
ncbi:MAG: PAS domain S-box protein, partial [Blastocatellia bacterium]